MTRLKLFFSISILLTATIQSYQAQRSFSRTFGGERDEKAMTAMETRAGAYVVAGLTFSYGKGKSDIWVLKLDPEGQEIWRKYLGSDDFDWANDIIETRKGNYVIAGYSQDPETGYNNAWVIELDRNGRVIWSNTYGGTRGDEAKSIIQTRDGGFAIAGLSHSYSRGKSDMWLLRLDQEGNELWQKTYGGNEADRAHDILETRDGGFLLGGYSKSMGAGKADVILVKVDQDGNGIWNKNYGGEENENIESMAVARDGGIVLAGWSMSGSSGTLDAFVMKVDESGKRLWSKTLGSEGKDVYYDVDVAPEGDIILAGATTSNPESRAKVWLTRMDQNGKVIWHKFSNGSKSDFGYAVNITRDGGFFIAGSTDSYAIGGNDMWVVKTDASGTIKAPKTEQDWVYTGKQLNVEDIEGNDNFKPNLYILSIGVSKFVDPEVNLSFANSDADSVAEKFRLMEGKLFNEVHVRKLIDEKATLLNIKMGISWLEQQATQKDIIMVFISSHGALDNKGNLYILPTDFNSYHLFATALNIHDLTEGMNGTPCKKLIFLDACHSGQSAFDLMDLAYIKSADLNDIVKELVDAEGGVTVMTSSSGKEYSYEQPDWGHGAFTKAILEGLDGEADYNDNEVINLMEMNLYVTERVKELTGGRQHPFTPINLFGDIPIYILEKKKKGILPSLGGKK